MTEAQKLKLIDGWEVVIGIEIHTQLATKSKIFSGSSTEFGQDPNTQASLVDLAMPGVLPVLNAEVVDLAIRFGLGIDAYIDQASVFARKNYFYQIRQKATKSARWTIRLWAWVISTSNLKMAL
jgi:aspartyl-tRNA(Asn)/glutamyl-tRNA(Gln) amidotransferase subunit B